MFSSETDTQLDDDLVYSESNPRVPHNSNILTFKTYIFIVMHGLDGQMLQRAQVLLMWHSHIALLPTWSLLMIKLQLT